MKDVGSGTYKFDTVVSLCYEKLLTRCRKGNIIGLNTAFKEKVHNNTYLQLKDYGKRTQQHLLTDQ
jgi:hypothetical protein